MGVPVIPRVFMTVVGVLFSTKEFSAWMYVNLCIHGWVVQEFSAWMYVNLCIHGWVVRVLNLESLSPLHCGFNFAKDFGFFM